MTISSANFSPSETRRLIYLDHQASTSVHPTALDAVVRAMAELPANPHAVEHAAGVEAADAVERARAQVAEAIAADADEVFFTSGATEADNLALLGIGRNEAVRRRVIVTAIEHKAVLGPARELVRRGFDVVLAPVTRDGVVDLDALARLVDDNTLLVSAMLVNNELGTVQPVAEVGAMCARVGALLHVDAAQALGWMPIDAYSLGAHLLSLSGHKAGGPKGVGALFVARHVRHQIAPLLHGGEQEDGLRPGTLPTPLCVGFGVACARRPSAEEVRAWRERSARLEANLLALWPGARVNGATKYRHPGSISLTAPGLDADWAIAELRTQVAISRGSACTSGILEPSHVLRAIGMPLADCSATLRLSTGRFTTDEEVEGALTAFRAMFDAAVSMKDALA